MAGADGARLHAPVAVVVPAYQAAAAVGAVVAGVRTDLPDATVYVVDDGSTDDTGAAAVAAGAIVLRHQRNRGKGAALASGMARAIGDGAGMLATLDADGQHSPQALPLLLEPLRRE